MALKLILALTALAAASAAPATFREALFCESWSPLGTNYATDDLFDYYCSSSQDRRSLTLRVIGKERETKYRYVLMGVVDSAGNPMVGTYKYSDPLRAVTCTDESKRLIKHTDDDINDVLATYTLPEDSKMKLEDLNCRFAVAQSLTQYYQAVSVDMFGKRAESVAEPTKMVEEPIQEVEQPTQEVAEPIVEVAEPTQEVAEPIVEVAEPTQEVAEPIVEVAEPTQEVAEPTQQVEQLTQDVEEPFIQIEEPFIDTNETVTAQTDNTTVVVTEPEVPVVEVAPTVEVTNEEFEPTSTIDETDNLQDKFEKEEVLGHETKVETSAPVITAPETVPETTDEFINEGEEEEPEYMVDDFGIRRMIIPEKEKKLIYKGISTGYWCEEMDNTYIMAPGTDCQMFYQTIMKEEDHNQVFPLASFNCAPGTRFNTFKCTCTLFDGMVCPDPNPDFKATTQKPEVSPVIDGNSLENTVTNSTEF